jgi:hypothetical protein
VADRIDTEWFTTEPKGWVAEPGDLPLSRPALVTEPDGPYVAAARRIAALILPPDATEQDAKEIVDAKAGMLLFLSEDMNYWLTVQQLKAMMHLGDLYPIGTPHATARATGTVQVDYIGGDHLQILLVFASGRTITFTAVSGGSQPPTQVALLTGIVSAQRFGSEVATNLDARGVDALIPA